ncbi:hypothetical protein, partial [Eggerthella lenta]|uniref:hypothetical protein n=1 Tax=Eggerthella lenta TaxID=84112 RepID=UPI001E64AD33
NAPPVSGGRKMQRHRAQSGCPMAHHRPKNTLSRSIPCFSGDDAHARCQQHSRHAAQTSG